MKDIKCLHYESNKSYKKESKPGVLIRVPNSKNEMIPSLTPSGSFNRWFGSNLEIEKHNDQVV